VIRNSIRVVAVMLFVFLSMITIAQHSPDKKARRNFERASLQARGYDYSGALNTLYQVVGQDSLYEEAWVLMGDIYLNTGDDFRALDAYYQALKGSPKELGDLLMILAKTELRLGMYEKAGLHFRMYRSVAKPVGVTGRFVEQMLSRVEFALNAIANPVPFNPENLGPNVNSPYDDYINAVSVDNTSLILTVKAPPSYHGSEYGTRETEDFYISRFDSLGWKKAVSLGPPINTAGNEGALTLSPDGRYIFFAGCDRADNNGRCDLYVSNRMGDKWSLPTNLGTMVNSAAWESQPSVSSDGKTIFFASNRPGGLGETDIWFTTINNDGTLTRPVNIGDVINTVGSEMAPFIHPDGKTLYFSSDGHMGMGGKDLFVSRKLNDTTWSKPLNLGYPINTFSDEMTIIVGSDGAVAYFSSDKYGGEGRYDVYKFNLYEEVRSAPITYLKGNVYDAETEIPLKASFRLTELHTGIERISSFSDEKTGEFLVCLPGGCDYLLAAQKEGYLYFSDPFYLTEKHSIVKPFEKDVPLIPVKKGKTIVTRNIFFDTDQYNIQPESESELQLIVSLLDQNPEISLAINGHTDNTGSESHNVLLSKNRALEIYNALIVRGVSADRLSYHGFGDTQPISDNTTPQGRAMNRRTEFIIQ